MLFLLCKVIIYVLGKWFYQSSSCQTILSHWKLNGKEVIEYSMNLMPTQLKSREWNGFEFFFWSKNCVLISTDLSAY
jgi:hypothetical protein